MLITYRDGFRAGVILVTLEIQAAKANGPSDKPTQS